jgi:hypothetical protein
LQKKFINKKNILLSCIQPSLSKIIKKSHIIFYIKKHKNSKICFIMHLDFNRVKDAKDEMDKAQQAIHTTHGNTTLCMRERDVVRNYASTVRAEESFFKQKARIQWLRLGDQNTSFFHKSVNGRHNRSRLLSVTREDGEVVEGHEAVKSEVIAYFQSVLGVK